MKNTISYEEIKFLIELAKAKSDEYIQGWANKIFSDYYNSQFKCLICNEIIKDQAVPSLDGNVAMHGKMHYNENKHLLSFI